ncbi:MAG: TPM domain-containing protein [Steroidobacteraceae bacterium]
MRFLKHAFALHWLTRRRFSRRVLDAIEQAIRQVESRHDGELRFAVETALELPDLWHTRSAKERALQVFGQLGVWDTAGNNGVLIYVLMADHAVEIVADRAIAARVDTQEWRRICATMRDSFREGAYEKGSVAGVLAVGELLARHFPGGRSKPGSDELPNQPVLL